MTAITKLPSEILIRIFELCEDFSDVTFDLLRDIQKALPNGNAEDILLERFNDETDQNYIIAHLKACLSKTQLMKC